MFLGVTNKTNEIPVLINIDQIKAVFPDYIPVDETQEEFEENGTRIYLVGENDAICVIDSYAAIKRAITEATNGRQ